MGWSRLAGAWAVPAWAAFLVCLALGPALGWGLVLSYDMVAVPDPAFSWDQLGVGSQLPRAVPLDAVATALTTVLPAAVVQKAALAGGLLAAGCGAAALVGTLPVAARLVAVTLAVWNPWVAERLVLGHWGLLLAYGALPWLVLSVRAGAVASWPRRILLLAVCSLTPTGGLLALTVLLVGAAVAGRSGTTADRRSLAGAGAAWLLLDAPWWLPGLLHGSAATSDEASVAAFAARGELPGGVLPTLLGLGGVWNVQVVPDSRGTPLAVASLVLVLVLGAVGVRGARRADARLLTLLLAAGGVGLLLALLGAVPGARTVLGGAVSTVPGAGLLRDGHKFAALLMPLTAVLVAHGAHAVSARLRDPATAGAVLVGAVVLPVGLLPDLAWGAGGRLDAVEFPPAWSAVREAVAAEQGEGDLLLLPWGAFRRYAWNGDRTVLDPARRAFPATALGDDRLAVGTRVLSGEDPRGTAILRALRAGTLDSGLLRARGVRLVLVQTDQPGKVDQPAGTEEVARAGALRLLRVPGPVEPQPRAVGSVGTALVVTADAAAAGLVLLAAGVAIRRHGRLRSRAAARPTRW